MSDDDEWQDTLMEPFYAPMKAALKIPGVAAVRVIAMKDGKRYFADESRPSEWYNFRDGDGCCGECGAEMKV